MGLLLRDMRELVREGLGGLTENDMPNPKVDRLLNMSFWHIWQKFESRERECRTYVETQDGVSEYGLPEDNVLDAIITVAIKDGQKADEGQWSKLHQISKREYDIRHNTEAAQRAKPNAYHRLQHTLILDPVPGSTIYTVRIIFWRTVENLIEGTLETTELPAQWDELVVEGAIERGHFYNEDYSQAAAAQNFKGAKLRDAVLIRDREVEDNRWAGLKVDFEGPDSQDVL